MGSRTVAAGTRVQIRYALLEPGQRAAGLPADTAAVPYVVRVKGILEEAAAVGDLTTIRTLAGRRLRGQLSVVEPADTHTFGRPVAALVRTAETIGRMLGAGHGRS